MPFWAMVISGGRRRAKTGERWKEHGARHRAEEAGEDLRLLYVALTRARCQVVTWWVPSTTTSCAPIHRLLFGLISVILAAGEGLCR